jgi:hypothetical protein
MTENWNTWKNNIEAQSLMHAFLNNGFGRFTKNTMPDHGDGTNAFGS